MDFFSSSLFLSLLGLFINMNFDNASNYKKNTVNSFFLSDIEILLVLTIQVVDAAVR
jgi:hypothetical protein